MIYIASDHGGYKLKKRLIRYIKNELKLEIEDMGPDQYDRDDDYPDFAQPLVEKVANDKNNCGILICGSGQGMCMLANKNKGIRAALGYSIKSAELSKQHNNANILCLAGYVLTEDHATAITRKWLATPFSNEERHLRRLRKMTKLEKNN